MSGKVEEKKPPDAAAGDSAHKAEGSVRGGVLWTTRLERASKSVRAQVRDVIAALGSKDPATRWVSLAFLLSTTALIYTVSIGAHRWWINGPGNPDKKREQSEQAKQVSEFLKKQSEDAKTRAAIVSLGTFTIELKEPETDDGKQARRVSGVMNMADIEIVLDCGDRDTRVFIEEHMAEVRNQLTNVLTPVERDELFTREGKKRLRKRMIERLNGWIPSGKIQDVYFPKLVVS